MSEQQETSKLIDPIQAGEKILQSARVPKSNEAQILDQLRDWFKQGAVIQATDIKGQILEDSGDGIWVSGLTIKFPEGVPASVFRLD